MERGGAWGLVVGTLLGPEGADASSGPDVFVWVDACLSVIPQDACPGCGVGSWSGGGCGVGDRPYFENCTVDASILVIYLAEYLDARTGPWSGSCVVVTSWG